jgi:tyrosyl-tRNA synthetase
MWRYFELLSFRPLDELGKWKQEVASGRNPRDIKVALAQEIVERFHGKAAAEAALSDFEARFRHGEIPEDMPEVTLPAPEGGLPVLQMLKQAGLTASTTEAMRMIEQGGVRLDGARLTDRLLKVAAGATIVAQVGKRKFARIRLT